MDNSRETRIRLVVLACLSIVVSSSTAFAHHSAAVSYDMSKTVELEGKITRVVWRNPHASLMLDVVQDDGEVEAWKVESIPVTRLTRVGIKRELLNVGDNVKVAGFPGRRSSRLVYATNMLLQDGREALLDSPNPRWTRDTVGTGTDMTAAAAGADPSLGIFRVWSNDGSYLATETRYLTEGGKLDYPLTDAASEAQANWDPLSDDNPFITCMPKGMPIIMQQPNPIEFVDKGDRIILRIEEFDTERVFYMTDEVPASKEPPGVLGRSAGQWEGATLVVRTNEIGWRYFDQTAGLKQSEAVETLERFTVNEEGSRLDYEMTITDPWLFTKPVSLSKSWRWVPGERILTYNCVD